MSTYDLRVQKDLGTARAAPTGAENGSGRRERGQGLEALTKSMFDELADLCINLVHCVDRQLAWTLGNFIDAM